MKIILRSLLDPYWNCKEYAIIANFIHFLQTKKQPLVNGTILDNNCITTERRL